MRSRIVIATKGISVESMRNFLELEDLKPYNITSIASLFDLYKMDFNKNITIAETEKKYYLPFKQAINDIWSMDRPEALSGAQFLIMHQKSNSYGFISLEREFWIIRVFNSNFELLKINTELIIRDLFKRLKNNNKNLEFLNNQTEIFEVQGNVQVAIGQIQPNLKIKTELIKKQKGIEIKAFRLCFLLALGIIIISFPEFRPFFDNISSTYSKWIIDDIATKLIGALFVTGAINYFNYSSYKNKIKDRFIIWN